MPLLSKKGNFKSPLESINNVEAMLGQIKTEHNKLYKKKRDIVSPNGLNEPQVKEAYANFLKNVSQSSSSKVNGEICSQFDNENNITQVSSSLSAEVLNSQEVKAAYIEHCKNVCKIDSINFMENFSYPTKNTKKNYTIDVSSLKKEIDAEPKKKKKINRARKEQKNKIQNTNEKKSKFKQEKNASDITTENQIKELSLFERIALIHESRNVGLYVLCDTCNKAR